MSNALLLLEEQIFKLLLDQSYYSFFLSLQRNSYKIEKTKSDGTIKIWSAENGNLITTLSNNGRIWDLASNKESLLASASGDSTVKVTKSYLFFLLFKF